MGMNLIAAIKEKQEAIMKLQGELDEARAMLDGAGKVPRIRPTRGTGRGGRPKAAMTPYDPNSTAGKAVSVLRDVGKPLHVGDLISHIERRGHNVNKTTLVGNLSRWVKKRELFYRAGPNKFGLREWKEEGKKTS